RGGEHYRELIQKVETRLAEKIAAAGPIEAPPAGRISRWVKHFPIEPEVLIAPEGRAGRWLVSVSCADRPGLLSSISRLLLRHELNLVDARVSTLGARAEDAFVVNGAAMEYEASRKAIADELRQELAS